MQALTTLQQQYDHTASHQSHWDELRRTSEKIEILTNLIGQAGNEELKELRCYRDRTRALESEHAALQKRFKEQQETKISHSERAALTARQSLAQAQQRSSEWERQAKEYEGQVELVGQADNKELKELRSYRDRTWDLEGEHAALQKRIKEQDTKISNSERAALTARQSLAQAQQRSSEWERRANEYEGQVELMQTKLDQAEQTYAQLEADHSLIKLQLEEQEANDRLSKASWPVFTPFTSHLS